MFLLQGSYLLKGQAVPMAVVSHFKNGKRQCLYRRIIAKLKFYNASLIELFSFRCQFLPLNHLL